jgi:hypothetical protein
MFVLVTAAFMIIAMWIFPEAVGKTPSPKQKRDLSTGT